MLNKKYKMRSISSMKEPLLTADTKGNGRSEPPDRYCVTGRATSVAGSALVAIRTCPLPDSGPFLHRCPPFGFVSPLLFITTVRKSVISAMLFTIYSIISVCSSKLHHS